MALSGGTYQGTDVNLISKIWSAVYIKLMPDRRFVLVVRDKTGRLINVSHYRPDSLDGAALLGHAFQSQDGYSVTILDRSTDPATEYHVDSKGKPVRVSS